MLRAEAAEFLPQEKVADCGYEGKEGAEMCSTAAPSPAMTASDLAVSPMLSPYWGFEDMTCCPDFDPTNADEATLWNVAAAAALYGGYMSEDCAYMPEFALPESDENYRDLLGVGPSYMGKAKFTLEGLEDLHSSLAGYLSTQFGEQDGNCQEDIIEGAPGLQAPPGLGPPPGLEDYEEEVEPPPGLEVTVAELHARLRKPLAKKDSDSLILPRGTTTAMLRNIPNKYTQLGLISRLYEDGFRGELDFIYLPIDFKNKCNVGYAFVNFRTAEACAHFAAEYHGSNSREKLPGYNSKKICEVSAARYQGCEENVRRLQASSVMSELIATPEWLPKLFDATGEEVEFPLPDVAAKEANEQTRSSRGRQQRRRGVTM